MAHNIDELKFAKLAWLMILLVAVVIIDMIVVVDLSYPLHYSPVPGVKKKVAIEFLQPESGSRASKAAFFIWGLWCLSSFCRSTEPKYARNERGAKC